MLLSLVLTGGGSVPQGTFGDVWRYWMVTQWVEGVATGIWWAEARDATKHSTGHRTVSHNGELSGPNVNSATEEMT